MLEKKASELSYFGYNLVGVCVLVIYVMCHFAHLVISAGFTHSAFAFGYEAGINKSTIDGNLVPPGALVTFVQKGLQYLELEANLTSVSLMFLFTV